MNTIREWLNGSRDYATGLALYQVYGQDSRLLRALAQGYSEYRQQRMVQALEALLQLGDRPARPAVPKKTAVRVAAIELPEAAVAAPEDPYRAEWLPKYQEMNYLRHQLITIESDEERGNAAHNILQLERACMAIWAKRDYHLRTGQPMPEEAEPISTITDLNQVHKSMVNVRTYISKAQKAIVEADTEAKKEGAMKRLNKYTDQLKELENKLRHG